MEQDGLQVPDLRHGDTRTQLVHVDALVVQQFIGQDTSRGPVVLLRVIRLGIEAVGMTVQRQYVISGGKLLFCPV